MIGRTFAVVMVILAAGYIYVNAGVIWSAVFVAFCITVAVHAERDSGREAERESERDRQA